MMKSNVLVIGNLLSHVNGTRSIAEDLVYYLAQEGWTVKGVSIQRNRLLRILDMLQIIIRYRQWYSIAYLEVYSGNAFIWAEICSLVLHLVDKPFILTLHGGNLPEFSRIWPRRVRKVLQRATLVTTPSIHIQSALSPLHSQILLLRNAVMLDSYEFRHRVEARARIVWLRAFHSIYAPEVLVESIALLQDAFPSIEVNMFGPDKGDGSLDLVQSIVAKLNLTALVHIKGSIPKREISKTLSPFDIFVNTTTVESFGVSVVEAAAMGMCIVTTSVGELPHIWTHEYDALLIPPNDPKALADAINRILTEPELAARISQNARQTAKQFDWSVILPQWERLLLMTIQRHQDGQHR